MATSFQSWPSSQTAYVLGEEDLGHEANLVTLHAAYSHVGLDVTQHIPGRDTLALRLVPLDDHALHHGGREAGYVDHGPRGGAP